MNIIRSFEVSLFQIGKLFKGVKLRQRAAAVPDNTRLYVVGDIHGRADLLEIMFKVIYQDIREKPSQTIIEVYIGDYVDRGRDSRGVLETLWSTPPLGDKRVCLKGNHEQMLLDFLSDATIGPSWTELGGGDTLLSYGVRPKLSMVPAEAERARLELRGVFPPGHYQFLNELAISFRCGGYFFAHAGVRPGVDLDQQDPEDLLWIRDPFLTSSRNFGAVVVHGHTPGLEPIILPNRICIDTGAFATGRLTRLVLEGTKQRFLQAK